MTSSHAPRIDSFCKTPGGRIHYVQQGEGPPLLLLHSNGCSLQEFAPVIEALAQDYRCIAWDMPGHGDSDGARQHRSIDDHAKAALELMDALGLESAFVCGASVGGFIAIAMAVAAPSRVSGVLIAEAALRSESEWAAQWPRIDAMFALPTQTHEAVAPRFRTLTPATLLQWNIDRNKAGGWRMVDVMWAIREYDVVAELDKLRVSQVPACVLLGDRGPVIGCRAQYEALLPHAPVFVIADAGHFPMLDDPQAFVAVVRQAVAGMTSRRGAVGA